MPTLRIDASDAGVRLDRFCRKRLDVPLSGIYKMIRTGSIRVDDRSVGPGHRLTPGEEVLLDVAPSDLVEPDEGPVRPGDPSWVRRSVLHLDDDLVVVSKPSGRVSHAGTGHPTGAVDDVRAWLRSIDDPDPDRTTPIHRLDRDTSGAMVFARTGPALRTLNETMAAGEVDKEYVALLCGLPEPVEGVIDRSLEKVATPEGDRVVASQGEEAKEARTRYRAERSFPAPSVPGGPTELALCRVELETGRTHQIRAHFAERGTPVAGDWKYGDAKVNGALGRALGLDRMFLHAARIGFRHPGTGERLEVEAPLPPELRTVLDHLT